MTDAPQLQSVLSDEEAEQMLRDTVIHFLTTDPRGEWADFFGRALADLYID